MDISHAPPPAALVRTAEQAITIIMCENAVDADTAAQMIRDRAAAHDVTIADLTQTIVTVASMPQLLGASSA